MSQISSRLVSGRWVGDKPVVMENFKSKTLWVAIHYSIYR